MGFMDELRKLTQPYDDDNDFFEGSESSLREAPPPSAAMKVFFHTRRVFSSRQPLNVNPGDIPRLFMHQNMNAI